MEQAAEAWSQMPDRTRETVERAQLALLKASAIYIRPAGLRLR